MTDEGKGTQIYHMTNPLKDAQNRGFMLPRHSCPQALKEKVVIGCYVRPACLTEM